MQKFTIVQLNIISMNNFKNISLKTNIFPKINKLIYKYKRFHLFGKTDCLLLFKMSYID